MCNFLRYIAFVLVFLTTTGFQPLDRTSGGALLKSSIPEDVPQSWENMPLTSENVARAIVDCKIQHPEVVFRQAIIESGNFKSKLCTKSNNIFGMRKARTRRTLAIGKTKSSYAVFRHWSHSIYDYKIWQGETLIKDYYQFLTKKRYSANGKYASHLKRVRLEPKILAILK